MSEAFLHYIWQHQYFDKSDLASTKRQEIHIVNPGFYNTDAGPDFKEAAITIADMEWRGHVEIHLKASDWNVHRHQSDKAYNNTILHVVWQNDADIYRQDGSAIPTLELAERVDKSLLDQYVQLVKMPSQHIPCENQIDEVDYLTRLTMIDKTLMSRMERKAEMVYEMLERNEKNWEETAYQLLAMNFGFKVNNEPFLTLSKSLPYKILKKHADNLFQVEALLFGQAGFLEKGLSDSYFLKLKKEYGFLRSKYQLEPLLSEFQWKLLRLRPANFPTVRISQFAAFLCSVDALFSFCIEADIKSLVKKLRVPISEYWQKHYQFDKETGKKLQGLGQKSAENICINTVAPLLVAYGKVMDEINFIERAEQLLQNLGPEENKIVDKMKEVGFIVESAFDSQAILELHNNYCLKSRCLHCNIGAKLVRP